MTSEDFLISSAFSGSSAIRAAASPIILARCLSFIFTLESDEFYRALIDELLHRLRELCALANFQNHCVAVRLGKSDVIPQLRRQRYRRRGVVLDFPNNFCAAVEDVGNSVSRCPAKTKTTVNVPWRESPERA
jgi:hypothetical protein